MSATKELLEEKKAENNEKLDSQYQKVSLYNILEAEDFVERMKQEDDTELEEYSKTLAIQEKNKVNAIVGFLRETDMFRLSFRKSESVVVDDVEKLEEKYIVVKKQADKTAIKKAIKGGETPTGTRLIVSNNLQIK